MAVIYYARNNHTGETTTARVSNILKYTELACFKQGLINWKRRLGEDYAVQRFLEDGVILTKEEKLKEGKRLGNAISSDAAAFGTLCHDLFERYLNFGLMPPENSPVLPYFKVATDYLNEVKAIGIETEIPVHYEGTINGTKVYYNGTADKVYGGTIGDWKFSKKKKKGFEGQQQLQVEAYRKALTWMRDELYDRTVITRVMANPTKTMPNRHQLVHIKTHYNLDHIPTWGWELCLEEFWLNHTLEDVDYNYQGKTQGQGAILSK